MLKQVTGSVRPIRETSISTTRSKGKFHRIETGGQDVAWHRIDDDDADEDCSESYDEDSDITVAFEWNIIINGFLGHDRRRS